MTSKLTTVTDCGDDVHGVELSSSTSGAQQTVEQMAEVVAEDGVDDGVGGRVGVRQCCDEDQEGPAGTERCR